MTIANTMRCLQVTKSDDGNIRREIAERSTGELPAGDVVVQVRYSSLNYKDALAATGHPGVVSRFPHVPGIDAAGVVVESNSPRIAAGAEVIVTSFELGAGRWGAYAQYIRVPADWVVPLPAGLSMRESMILGTAGLTAAMSLDAIKQCGIQEAGGDVAVTGASGGVGTSAIAILAKAGYRVVAVSGKPGAQDLLKRLGAAQVLSRDEVLDQSGKPLLKARFAAAVDTVGGKMLADVLRSMKPQGCVAACGLVGGVEIPTTVYPFILRGVRLWGIDSAWYSADKRAALWKKLAGAWKPETLNEIVTEVTLDELEAKIQEILAGRNIGRVIVALD